MLHNGNQQRSRSYFKAVEEETVVSDDDLQPSDTFLATQHAVLGWSFGLKFGPGQGGTNAFTQDGSRDHFGCGLGCYRRDASRCAGSGRRRHLRSRCTSRASRLRSTPTARTRLHLDTGLLGVGRRRLLLGPRRMGTASKCRRSLDPWLLGVRRRPLRLARRLLGATRRLLWRCELRLRLWRHWILWW